MTQTAQENILNDQVIETISRTAIKVYQETARKELKLKTDRRLHNVKKLLSNYKRIEQSIQNVKHKHEEGSDMSIEEIMTSEYMIESLNESHARSDLMIQHVKRILQAYEYICDLEGHPERFRIVRDRFVYNIEVHVLMEKYSLSSKSIYRQLDKASEELAVLLFGIDAVPFEVD